MGLVSISVCPICDATKFKVHLTCKDYTSSQENFTLKKCESCHFVFTDPRPDKLALPNYYLSDKYISHTGGSQNLIDKIYLLARKITLGWKSKLIKKNSSGKSILDIGCGTGEFLNEMKFNGWKITGVEPSTNARATAEQITGSKIYMSLSEVQELDLDIITLWHVLEHLPDPNEALQSIYRLLKKTGTIFIAVPNLKSYDAEYYQSFWAAYDVPRHLWHFDKNNMKILLEKNGFKLVDVFPMKLDAFYVSMLSESYKHLTKSKLLQLFSAFLIGLKSNFLANKTSEYSSLIYVVKR